MTYDERKQQTPPENKMYLSFEPEEAVVNVKYEEYMAKQRELRNKKSKTKQPCQKINCQQQKNVL